MQLDDEAIRQTLHADVVSVWEIEQLRADRQRVANAADQYPKVRIRLLPGSTEESGPGVPAHSVMLPHRWEVTGSFRYEPGDPPVDILAAAKWSALSSFLTQTYPFYAGWRYREGEWDWDWEDNDTERTYDVILRFTLEVVMPVKSVVPP